MPREASITYDQVAAYSEAMVAEGKKPNPRSIRDRHGSGSLGTIHKLFLQWEVNRAPKFDPHGSIPTSIQRSMMEYLGAEISLARADLEARLTEIQSLAKELAAENEKQVEQISHMGKTVEDHLSQKAGLEGRIDQLCSELAVARDEAARERQSAEIARTELAKSLLRLESLPRLESDLESTRSAYLKSEQRC